jgi:predicted nucleotidyltransferase
MHNNEKFKAEALQLVSKFVAVRYPNASAALLAGSASRGEATPASDYDVVLLFDKLPEGAWREMVSFEDHDFEVFAHDLETLSYFLREVEIISGKPVLAKMIAEGLPIASPSTAIIATAKQMALATLQSGPPPLDKAAFELRRYAITDLAQALSAQRDEAIVLAIGTSLYTALAEFFLRTASQWNATGKAIPNALTAIDPKTADQFANAFSSLFKTGNTSAVQTLVDTILAPHGGRMRAGFKQQAPPSWRD